MPILLFPGQGSQSPGMGKEIYEANQIARELFVQADDILGFSLSKVMFDGTAEELKKTSVTQPAVFLNSIVRYIIQKDALELTAVAGHSLGEITALVANDTLSFEDGLILVSHRAKAMQEACDLNKGTMAAILGLEDNIVEEICTHSEGTLVAANYNCPGQLVISGGLDEISSAIDLATEKGARRALQLKVDGAFHSPHMAPAQSQLEEVIHTLNFQQPTCPIYQNYTGQKETDPEQIKNNLIAQLTHSVKWTQSMMNMVADGETEFIEFGSKVLSGFIKKVDRSLSTTQY